MAISNAFKTSIGILLFLTTGSAILLTTGTIELSRDLCSNDEWTQAYTDGNLEIFYCAQNNPPYRYCETLSKTGRTCYKPQKINLLTSEEAKNVLLTELNRCDNNEKFCLPKHDYTPPFLEWQLIEDDPTITSEVLVARILSDGSFEIVLDQFSPMYFTDKDNTIKKEIINNKFTAFSNFNLRIGETSDVYNFTVQNGFLISNTVNDVFIYDTSKDGDTAWLNDSTTSWWKETNSSTRGVCNRFPTLAGVIMQQTGASIISLSNDSNLESGCDPYTLWMKFSQGAGYMYGGGGTPNSVSCAEGICCFGIDTANLRCVDFKNDIYKVWQATGDFTGQNISQRDTSQTLSAGAGSPIVASTVTDVELKNIGGSLYACVAQKTAVSVINMSGTTTWDDAITSTENQQCHWDLNVSGALWYTSTAANAKLQYYPDLPTADFASTKFNSSWNVTSIASNHDFVFIGTVNDYVYKINKTNLLPISNISFSDDIYGLSFFNDNLSLAIASKDGNLKIVNSTNFNIIETFNNESGETLINYTFSSVDTYLNHGCESTGAFLTGSLGGSDWVNWTSSTVGCAVANSCSNDNRSCSDNCSLDNLFPKLKGNITLSGTGIFHNISINNFLINGGCVVRIS